MRTRDQIGQIECEKEMDRQCLKIDGLLRLLIDIVSTKYVIYNSETLTLNIQTLNYKLH